MSAVILYFQVTFFIIDEGKIVGLRRRCAERKTTCTWETCRRSVHGALSVTMSLVVFDDDARQYRVVIPAVQKLPPNPHISGSDALTRALAPPSETASNVDSESPPEPRLEKTLRHLLLACDQLSFFTC